MKRITRQNLDNQNGGFTVFGRVADSASLAVMNQIAAVQPVDASNILRATFNALPLINFTGTLTVQNLIT